MVAKLSVSHSLSLFAFCVTFSNTFRQQLSYREAASLPLPQWKKLRLVRGSYVDEKVSKKHDCV